MNPAIETLAEVERLAVEIRASDKYRDSSFIRLGTALLKIRQQNCWQEDGYKSFPRYLDAIEPKFQRGRAYLRSAISIAEYVLPVIPAEDLLEIGITKASALQTVIKDGRVPSAGLIELAKAGTTAQLKAEIAGETGIEAIPEDGTWFDFGIARLTVPDRAEFLRAVNVVARVASVPVGYVIKNWSKVPGWAKREIFRWLCVEFLTAHEAEIANG